METFAFKCMDLLCLFLFVLSDGSPVPMPLQYKKRTNIQLNAQLKPYYEYELLTGNWQKMSAGV